VYGREGMDRPGARGNVTCQILRPNLWCKFVRGPFAVHESITAGLLCVANRRIYVLQAIHIHKCFKCQCKNFVFELGKNNYRVYN
jgi:hypothetical protein